MSVCKALDEAQKEANKMQEAEQGRVNILMSQKKELEELLRKVKIQQIFIKTFYLKDVF